MQVVQENTEFFAGHGVDIHALESAARNRASGGDRNKANKSIQRSSTTLLVKNLPHDCVEAELESMFTKFGDLGSFLMPPSKTMLLVEFLEPTEARAAFKGLAYRKYKHLPLYIEWAPLGVIDKKKVGVMKSGDKHASNASSNDKDKSTGNLNVNVNGNFNGNFNDGDEGVSGYRSLFVKNLSFETSEETLSEHISHHGGMHAYIYTHVHK
jgi:multiple RNA-binding domain-containing protein 1